MGRDRDQPREFRPTKRKANPNEIRAAMDEDAAAHAARKKRSEFEDKAKRLTENKGR